MVTGSCSSGMDRRGRLKSGTRYSENSYETQNEAGPWFLRVRAAWPLVTQSRSARLRLSAESVSRAACSLDYSTVITGPAARQTLAVGLLHTRSEKDSAVCRECQVIYLRYAKPTDDLTVKRRDRSLVYAASDSMRDEKTEGTDESAV
ncbi:hypothetical protein SKAU_G00188480 [Synaphobranchus kaupii]|uniref:Uncharacterized protein n=1 Tax=Synaphobranchus kaupii TaxID=118154 RepID=A0A9Q1FD75_SYNKA|nr:hypothetical protein SKAU_G00188480 [Synaphobranchus kaupii]